MKHEAAARQQKKSLGNGKMKIPVLPQQCDENTPHNMATYLVCYSLHLASVGISNVIIKEMPDII